MKRIFFASLLFTALFNTVLVHHASAQTTVSVSATDFTTKVNQLDSEIVAGDLSTANTTWISIHNLMKAEMAVTKSKIAGAATATDKASYTSVMSNQVTLYQAIWNLKKDLATNRAALHTKLGLFAATIY